MQAKNAITAAVAETGDVIDQSTAAAGSVVLRGLTVALDSDVGEMFIADCARNTEGLISDLEIRAKYELSDEDWERLAGNIHLLRAVRAQRERRILSGECAREAAQRHFAGAPHVLHRILIDDQVSPRHRIEAARELRQAAGNGPDASQPRDKFIIQINLGADEKLVKEFTPCVPAPPSSDDGEV
jgi:hypothetical protein